MPSGAPAVGGFSEGTVFASEDPDGAGAALLATLALDASLVDRAGAALVAATLDPAAVASGPGAEAFSPHAAEPRATRPEAARATKETVR